MECSEKNCNLEKLENDNKCILHSHNKNKSFRKFWIEIRKDLKNNHSKDKFTDYFNPNVIYKDIKFPIFEEHEEPEDKYDLDAINNFYFENEDKLYIDSVINECDINFENCEFWENVHFENYHFGKKLSFINCIFEKEIFLNNEINADIEFKKCDFKNQIFNISNKIFNKSFIFIDCKNVGFISSSTNFKNLTSYAHSKLNKSIFEKTTFEDIAVFTNTEFVDDIKFEYSTFLNNTFFNESKIYSKIDLKNIIFKSDANFLDIKNKNDKDLKAENIANRETARIIKNSFEKQNNIIEANKFYALEMKKREEELFCKGSMMEWLIFFFHKITSNNSQSWLLALFWIVILSILGIGNNPIDSIIELFYCNNPFDLIANSFYSIFIFDTNSVTFYKLILKLFMGYLIYQFIISIRQNTRRK